MDDKNSVQIRNLLLVLLVIALMAVFKVTSSVSINVILAVLIFLIVLPLVSALEKWHIPSSIASILAVLLIVMVFAGAVWFIIYVAELLVKILPSYSIRMNQFDAYLSGILSRWFDIPKEASLMSLINIDWAAVLVPVLKSVSNRAVSLVSNASVIILLTVFLLLERHTIVPKIMMVTQGDNQKKAIDILDNCNRQVSKYLVLKVLVSAITGIVFYIICRVVELDFAFVWAVLTFVMNFIPTFGSIIITFVIILMSMLQFLPHWSPVIFVAISTIATQNLIGNIIEPRVQGTQLNLSAFVILVALSVFGYIWGIVGMFVAVPLLSIVEIIMFNMDSTKGLAIMLSSSNSFKRNVKRSKKGMERTQPSLFDADYTSQKKD